MHPAPPRFWIWLFCAAIWAYSALRFCATGIVFAHRNFLGDFLANFPTHAVAIWLGRADVLSEVIFENRLWMSPPHWGYGPVMHLITLPLFALPSLHEMYRAWLYVNYVFLALACWLLYRVTMPRPGSAFAIAVFGAMALNFYPLYEGLIQRNIEIFELLLLVGAMACYAKRRDVAVGSLIGLAAMTKFLPAIFVPYFAWKGRWRACGAALVVIAMFVVAAQWTLDWQHNWVLIQLHRGTYLETPLNQSITGLLLRALIPYGLPVATTACRVALIALGCGLLVLLGRSRRSDDWPWEWSMLIVAMVMLLPHNQNYYLMFLLIPYAVVLGRAMAGRLSRPQRTMALLSWAATGWVLPMSLWDRVLGAGITQRLLAWSVPVWGAIALVAVLALGWRKTASLGPAAHCRTAAIDSLDVSPAAEPVT